MSKWENLNFSLNPDGDPDHIQNVMLTTFFQEDQTSSICSNPANKERDK